MTTFDSILDKARSHHPDLDDRLAAHAGPRPLSELAALPDDRWLSLMTRCVFQAGFVWKVIEAKWDGFEAAFGGFDPLQVSFYSDDDVARLASDERIVRNGQKIMATVHNAGFVADMSREHGGFGRFIADWPTADQPGMLDLLKKKGSRLSGMTAQYFLRFSGWDAWILSGDVSAALVREGVLERASSSATAMRKAQAAITQWAAESGRTQSEISRILALSTG